VRACVRTLSPHIRPFFAPSNFSGIFCVKTFLLVTGPKTDLWLVKTVGIVLATIGATLVICKLNAQVNSPVIFLAIGSALSLTVVEVIYVAKRVISPIYLGDALVELVLIGWWVWIILFRQA
jgi:hypothetical protein